MEREGRRALHDGPPCDGRSGRGGGVTAGPRAAAGAGGEEGGAAIRAGRGMDGVEEREWELVHLLGFVLINQQLSHASKQPILG